MKRLWNKYLLLPVLLMLAGISFGGIKAQAEDEVYVIDISKIGDAATLQQWKDDGYVKRSSETVVNILKTPVKVTGTNEGLYLYFHLTNPKGGYGRAVRPLLPADIGGYGRLSLKRPYYRRREGRLYKSE